MVRLEDMFQMFPRLPMSVEVKVENDKLIQEVILQAGWGSGAGWPGSLSSLPPPSSQIARLVRRFDRSEITIWASEKNSVMKKCKAAVSLCPPTPVPGAPSPRSWGPVQPDGPVGGGSGRIWRVRWRGKCVSQDGLHLSLEFWAKMWL